VVAHDELSGFREKIQILQLQATTQHDVMKIRTRTTWSFEFKKKPFVLFTACSLLAQGLYRYVCTLLTSIHILCTAGFTWSSFQVDCVPCVGSYSQINKQIGDHRYNTHENVVAVKRRKMILPGITDPMAMDVDAADDAGDNLFRRF
jgi:hypothetical protein